MSNPLINRWGQNIFWHNFWYTDSTEKKHLHHDYYFNQLICIFLFYGVNISYNVFANAYWFNFRYKNLRFKPYFRYITRKPNQFGEVLTYSLRQEKDCLFPMKIWILRFSRWLVINQYWFHPIKKKNVRGGIENPHHLDNIIKPTRCETNNYQTFKTLFYSNLIPQLYKLSYYRF